jgi:hypothetical protein
MKDRFIGTIWLSRFHKTMKTIRMPEEIKKKIPNFVSYKHEADFWDNHSFFDLSPIDPDDKVIFDSEDDFNLWLKLGDDKYGEIKGEAEKLTETLIIKISPSLKEKIKRAAKSMQITPSTLDRISLSRSFSAQTV